MELTLSRCACAAVVTPADWSVPFGYWFRAPQSHQRTRAHRGDVARETSGRTRMRAGKESSVASTAPSSSGRSPKDAPPRDVSISPETCIPSVSTRLCQPICYGCHLGEILQTVLRAVPRSPIGNVRCRHGHLKLQLFSSSQPLLSVSSSLYANPFPQQQCTNWALAISQSPAERSDDRSSTSADQTRRDRSMLSDSLPSTAIPISLRLRKGMVGGGVRDCAAHLPVRSPQSAFPFTSLHWEKWLAWTRAGPRTWCGRTRRDTVTPHAHSVPICRVALYKKTLVVVNKAMVFER